MKQTVEEAAMNFANYESNNLDKLPFKVKNVVDYDNGLTRGFKAGAEWQAKQSPWISVKERLPNNDENIFYTNHLSGALGVGFYVDEKWYQAYTGEDIYGITHWMPIPSFDEILEANKDVLERIKEQGD